MSTLKLPIDLSQIPEADRKQQRVRVAVQQGDKVRSSLVSLEDGKAEVKLDVDRKQPVAIAVGPESASDEDLFHFQTLTASLSPNQWGDKEEISLSPILVTLPWWDRWRRWCRDFVITGTLLCADGSPVPGAEVKAYDVDFFWWWSSVIQVGPAAITDSSGHFTIRFRWCCGWWPWWWWRLRAWRLEPLLVDKIQPILKLNPDLRLPEPSPVPSFDFSSLLSRQPLKAIGSPTPTLSPSLPKLSPALAVGRQIDPSVLPALRERLTAVLPHVPELERLRIWPWIPWTPWFDCTPDIIFRATQSCGGAQPKVIVSETIFQTRWDIPTHLNVTLVANQDACCLPSNPQDPPGDCFLFTGVCGDPGIPVTSIGRTGATAGYADPGGRDRPFSESIYLGGQFGSSAQADYYEIEYTSHGANVWAPLPAAALLDMTRGYFDSTQPWPNQWFYPGFPVKTFGARNVYESRHHYEATHPPANWGSALTGRSWFYNVNQVASIQTAGVLADGAYDFRVIGYRALPNGDLDPATRKVMDGCGGHQDNNLLVLFIDNRVVGPQTPGTVHVNTNEPDCGIDSVRIGGTLVAACGSHQLQPGTHLEVDFFVTDPDGHLDHYELVVKYDLGSFKNLLDSTQVGTFTLVPPPGGSAGPDYANAVPPLPRPTWQGGAMKLIIDDAAKVFPKTCCYLIELTAWKRNIANCDGHLSYYNQMHYSFTVVV